MKKTVGMMIQEILIKKDISQQALGRGLCTKSELSRYLNGTRRIDRLLLTVFLQRIGKSPMKFSVFLTAEEYVYFEWRQKICIAHKNRDWKQMEKLLQEDMAKDRSCNEILQEQFSQIMQAIVQEKVYHNSSLCLELLTQAIDRTVPGFQKGLKKDTLLGTQEISAILLWQRLEMDKDKAFLLLNELIEYLGIHYQDMQELSQIYPQVAGEYLKLLIERKKYEKCLLIAEQTLNMMVTTGYASQMGTILKSLIEVKELLGITQEVKKQRIQLRAWQELLMEIRGCTEYENDELYLMDVWQEIGLAHEAISTTRKEMRYSQEKLSEDICTPETMSRIENGKQGLRKSTYKALAKKLSLPGDFYFNTIETDNFEVLELQWWLEVLITEHYWYEAEAVLQKLKGKLDLGIKKNLLYIEKIQYSIESSLRKLSNEKKKERLISILQLTIPDSKIGCWKSEWFWKHYFTREEMSILIKVADVLYASDRFEEEAELLENMLQFYKKSRVRYDNHYPTVLFIIERMTSVYFRLSDYEKIVSYAEEGIGISYVYDNMKLLSGLVNNKADALEHLGQREASLKYYRLAFYCADLMKIDSAVSSKRSYEKLLGEEIKWY